MAIDLLTAVLFLVPVPALVHPHHASVGFTIDPRPQCAQLDPLPMYVNPSFISPRNVQARPSSVAVVAANEDLDEKQVWSEN